MQEGSIFSLNVSEKSGESKKPVDQITIDDQGIVGDAHRGSWHRQVSLLAQEDIEAFESQVGRRIKPGEFAENITTETLDLKQCCIFDRFEIGDVILEVSQIGKKCHGDSCAIYREIGKCIMPDLGIFCRVIKGGAIKKGDPISCIKTPLRFMVITLSDRAAAGEYEDKSGPRVAALLDSRYLDSPRRIEVDRQVLPDDPAKLKAALLSACQAGIHVVITTGSTGVGPRDIAPDVIAEVADKTIPGIMEAIRIKCSEDNPKALLSRSMAAVKDKTVMYCIPGSVGAVEDYVPEICKTLEHTLFMLRGIDAH